ncbi:MAG: GNAT family N-acetyltransferase [Proteobacteria bacterium]|jgi:putative N-acetyltransferase (TIGR04045 family)|nr:GNAT family N-acetyltransferase [Pseudomonadota bacterium]
MKPSRIEIHPARDQDELKEAYALREEVFVRELGMFAKTDRDDNDNRAIHLIALDQRKVAGTVRIYREEGNWMGGRLAVDKHYRKGVGRKLVKAAEEEVKKQGGNSMQALIQSQNAAFFARLGWRRVGSSIEYLGRTHYRMEKVFG